MATETGQDLDPLVAELATGPNFAALTTLLPNGAPHTHPVWVGTDGRYLLVNTQSTSRKYQNVQRDPRVSLLILDATNPYRYAEVRGEVIGEVRGPEAVAQKDELSYKYHGAPFAGRTTGERVILRIAPRRQVTLDIRPPVARPAKETPESP